MSSLENPPVNNDSEMEEGEIVDDLDDLSDISSEEEFLLRQRLQVLENYNNVLERKKAKRASILSGENEKAASVLFHDLSEISATELEDSKSGLKNYSNIQTYQKQSYKQKRFNIHNGNGKVKEIKKKNNRRKKLELKVVSESSEESDDEYRNKRRKLANAVALNKCKVDTSLKARLEKMLYVKKSEKCLNTENIGVSNENALKIDSSNQENVEKMDNVTNSEEQNIAEFVNGEEKESDIKDVNTKNPQTLCQEESSIELMENNNREMKSACELIDLCSEDSKEIEIFNIETKSNDFVDSCNNENTSNKQDSDDELEVLRQHALKTKSLKKQSQPSEKSNKIETKPQSEDDDSDTADLRLICLKSALLKKAIEMKLKQKLRKRLKTKSISLQDDLLIYQEEMDNITDIENNTDIESVDMDIGSDGDDRVKEPNGICDVDSNHNPLADNKGKICSGSNRDDELDEDEDLLRAKLLTSLSKNLPNLLETDITTAHNDKTSDNTEVKVQPKQNASEKSKFIINLEDSDSEGEHEATKNLTKMHMKLSEQVDFQQKLDMFLKSTRMKVESDKLPDVVQQPSLPKPHVKYIPKAVTHLPKSEQIEYKNLVKRMAELEKIKQARQTSMNLQNNISVLKETLNPRNIANETRNKFPNNLEERIALSRKTIAEESAKMLKLKEEATKLLQKYKIVATELRNISTAITLNKKEQRTVQNKLSRIRIQHQSLLKSSSFKHSTVRSTLVQQTNNKIIGSKLQKENDPTKNDYKSPSKLKAVTVSVVNNLQKECTGPSPALSVQVDVNSNKKIVNVPDTAESERLVNLTEENSDVIERKQTTSPEERSNCDTKDINLIHPVLETNNENVEPTRSDNSLKDDKKDKEISDYQSPLEAFESTTWQEDPNAFLCPYEVGGSCRDPDCKFLHPKFPSHQ
ncbi:putative leucine-rich repeat-containing protein DDB_G0290503 [Battus philenor]|uniref:putative leucine-rich repeat-containing protein DDB_G0290503 n=1 Tax=Battus philenor TaxID=42288 RepID=UPI0035D13516